MLLQTDLVLDQIEESEIFVEVDQDRHRNDFEMLSSLQVEQIDHKLSKYESFLTFLPLTCHDYVYLYNLYI